MTKAVIKSDRPAAAVYNGMAAKIVRKVEKGDPSFNEKQAQVIAIVNDREHYFYVDEVVSGDGAPVTMSQEQRPRFDKEGHAATPDQAAWDAANMANTVGSMEYYLMQFPAGTYAEEARRRRSQMGPSLPSLAPLPKEMQPPKPPEPVSDKGRPRDGSAIEAANVGTAKDEDRTGGSHVQSAEHGVDAPPKPLDQPKGAKR